MLLQDSKFQVVQDFIVCTHCLYSSDLTFQRKQEVIASSKEEKNIAFYYLCHNSKFPFISTCLSKTWICGCNITLLLQKLIQSLSKSQNFLFAFVVWRRHIRHIPSEVNSLIQKVTALLHKHTFIDLHIRMIFCCKLTTFRRTPFY